MKVFYNFIAVLLVSTTGMANAADAPYADTLLGDVGGARTKLANQGVEIELGYSGDVWAVTHGGLKRKVTYLDFMELRANLDGEKLFGIKGNTMSVSLINSNGTQTNASNVGSTQGIDNSEVAVNGVRLYEAWVNQEFMDGRLAVLFGLHDLNTEFAATPISDNFLKPTMQIGQSFAQSGKNGPSVFPTTSVAGRVKFKPTETSYVAVAAYDGVPGDPDNTSGGRVRFADKDGLLWVGEVGITPKAAGTEDEVNKLALGVWHYTAELENIEDASRKSTAEGLYLLSSYRFYHDQAAGRALGAFLRGGIADGDTAQVDYDYEVGLIGNGWMPGRADSEIGLGLSTAHNSDAHMAAQAAASTDADRSEYSYELYYRDTLYPGISIQPDLQYIVNPGTDAVTDNATVLGLRLDVSF